MYRECAERGILFLDKKFTAFVSRSHVEERVEVTGCSEQLDTCDPESGRLRMSVPWSGSKVMAKIHPPVRPFASRGQNDVDQHGDIYSATT